MKRYGLWISLLSLVLVLWLIYLDTENVSPGDLSASHARLEELSGGNGCTQCHGGSSKSMTESCLACHQDIHIQFIEKRGFHAQINPAQANHCAGCHSEHHGSSFAIAGRQSFLAARIANPEKYTHEGLGFQLAGKHGSLRCEDCHHLAQSHLLEKGQKRFLGLKQTCTQCHEDVHRGEFGADCGSCHGQEKPFKQVAQFQHSSAFPLIGGHANVTCSQCHEKGSKYAIDFLTAWRRKEPTSAIEVRSCEACHESPHQKEFLNKVSKERGLAPNASCQSCHQAEHNSFASEQARFEEKLHIATGFALSKPHQNLSCEDCHSRVNTPTALQTDTKKFAAFFARYPGRKAQDCESCHGDPHQKEFQGGPFQNLDCLSCHDAHQFKPSHFQLEQHARTRFPLSGAHAAVSCQFCHKKMQEFTGIPGKIRPVRSFEAAPLQCESCHEDVHQGAFDSATFSKTVSGKTGCARCHNEESFHKISEIFDHKLWTGFALTGAHVNAQCSSCHPSSNSRQFGKAAGKNCEACHADFHEGAFDRTSLPKQVDGQSGCARCHNSESFRKPIRAFDHGKWTGYSLSGAHSALQCNACHIPTPGSDRFSKAAGRSCESCHTDPHIGQFRENGKVDCARCHFEAPNFQRLSFDHQKQSRFPLDKDHAKLNCAACHQNVALPNGAFTVRYKPLGVRCQDCHDPRRNSR